MSETVSFVGVVDGMRTSEVTHSTQITTDFVDLETNRKAPHELCFAELAEASDALLIGFPSLCLLGFSTDMDDDGNIWITLSKLGITTLAETPVEDDRVARCACQALYPTLIDGPAVQAIDVICSEDTSKRWICDAEEPGVKVVEGPLRPGRQQVFVSVEPGKRLVVSGSRVPWRVVPCTPETAARAAVAATMTTSMGRQLARESKDRAGYLFTEHGERVLSVRLHDKCTHKDEHWERRSCGHAWCKMCNGWVHPGTRVALKGPSAIVSCNRQWHKLDEYKYLFRENCAGSKRLTQAMQRELGHKRVAPAEDVRFSDDHDMLNDNGRTSGY